MGTLPHKFKDVYEEYYLLHPDASALPKTELNYLHRQWIFPNHIDVMLELVVEFRDKYYPDADLGVALFAALLHDAGLVYKRVNASPAGHEDRSREYANIILAKNGFDKEFIAEVCDAIASTEPEIAPKSDEAIIVRNADAYSHLASMHFFAKSHFADDLLLYIDWFDKKVHLSLKKLTIPELIEEKQPLVEQYEKLLARYRAHQGKRFIDRF